MRHFIISSRVVSFLELSK